MGFFSFRQTMIQHSTPLHDTFFLSHAPLIFDLFPYKPRMRHLRHEDDLAQIEGDGLVRVEVADHFAILEQKDQRSI